MLQRVFAGLEKMNPLTAAIIACVLALGLGICAFTIGAVGITAMLGGQSYIGKDPRQALELTQPQEQQQQGATLVGAGDIADCSNSEGIGSDGGDSTAKLLDQIPGTVFTLGDNAYESGTNADFKGCYDYSWGRHKARTYPAVGNHEYFTANASGYFAYFGAAAGDAQQGYYSYDLGDWHVVVLNSMCENVGGCEGDAPMLRWLKGDLATHPKSCTLSYWHHPRFSSGSQHGGADPKMEPAWEALYAANADVVLNAHSHIYERFAPQDPSGVADWKRGIREFVVGTGGAALHSLGEIQPNSEVRNPYSRGVLKLTLYPSSYEWEFIPVAGKRFGDAGSGSCH